MMLKKLYKSTFSESFRNRSRNTIQRALYPIYLGNKYSCNCCGKSFKRLLPKGNVLRMNAKCPFCFSLERERVLEFYLDKELAIYNKTNYKVLHFAPEYALSHRLSQIKDVEYIDADINPALASYVVDITDIPYDDESFDLIICAHVLGHVPNEALAIKELHRVLKSNGIALVMTLINHASDKTFEDENQITSEERLKAYGEFDLCRLHGQDFSDRLQESGFNVERIDYRKFFPKEFQERYCMGDGQREIIFKCSK